MKMILKPDQCSAFSNDLGAKTLGLIRLMELGLSVPDFVAIPFPVVETLNNSKLNTLVSEILESLSADTFAVRSSASCEDGCEQSFAGQFLTKLAVPKKNLAAALQDVISHSQENAPKGMRGFSVIVQEYIHPERSGVVFTRDPQGGREMIIESHNGIGEVLVSGKILPERRRFYWSTTQDDALIQQCQLIENAFKWPQDIEWCEKDGNVYFLQTRPITTVTSSQHAAHLAIDELFKKKPSRRFLKTGIAEVVHQPVPFMRGLLKDVYAEDGPIHVAYQNLGIAYTPQPFFQMVQSDLFVDEHLELKTLFPSFSKHPSGRTKIDSWKGLGRSLVNFWRVRTLKPAALTALADDLRKSIEYFLPGKVFEDAYATFLDSYRLVFEVNVLAEKALKDLRVYLKSDVNMLPEILGNQFFNDDEIEPWNVSEQDLKGNGLDITDESPFKVFFGGGMNQSSVCEWWESLPKWKKAVLEPKVRIARFAQQLRERGRWLTVLMMNDVRNALFSVAKVHGMDSQLGYFLFPEEVAGLAGMNQELLKRKVEYESECAIKLPLVLEQREYDHEHSDTVLGVSGGRTTGKLVTLEDFKQTTHRQKVILVVPSLTPDLVQYFPDINGILSENGGMLSHLAILAREHGLPVVSGVRLNHLEPHIGQQVSVDGTLGVWEASSACQE